VHVSGALLDLAIQSPTNSTLEYKRQSCSILVKRVDRVTLEVLRVRFTRKCHRFMPAVMVRGLATLGTRKANAYRIAQRAIVCAIMVGIACQIASTSLSALCDENIAQSMA